MSLFSFMMMLCCAINIGVTIASQRILAPICFCLGHHVIYECSNIGEGSTVWNVEPTYGQTCQITLFHIQFQGNVSTFCNGQTIVGQATRKDNDCYTSQLSIPTSSEFDGSTITCLHISDQQHSMEVGTSRLNISVMSPPPPDLQFIFVDQGELTFSLMHLPCISNYRMVQSENCGSCLATNTSMRTCRFPEPAVTELCTIEVYSECGNISSTIPSNFSVNLAVLQAHSIDCIPHYSAGDRTLKRLVTEFDTTVTVPFIVGGSESPIISYSIVYSSSVSGDSCGLPAILPASSCSQDICRHTFDVLMSFCPQSNDINVTVFATSTLGSGIVSYPLKRDGINNLINLHFDDQDLRNVTCEFLNEPEEAIKECTVKLTYGAQCAQEFASFQETGTGDTITVYLLDIMEDITGIRIDYCLNVTACSQNRTVVVEKVLSQPSANPPTQNDTNIVLAIVLTVTLAFVLMTMIITTVLIYWCRSRTQHQNEQQGTLKSSESIPKTQDQLYIQTNVGQLSISKKKKIGSGMFGYVFEGKLEDKPCAVKVLHEIGTRLTLNLPISLEGGAVQESRLSSFQKECKFLLELKHPNIVQLIEVFHYPHQNFPCLIMELLDCNIRDYFKEKSKELSILEQTSLSYDIVKALTYLHGNKVIHRDLCGDNILIRKGNTIPVAKIADFGMSRIFDMETMTHSISVLGHRNGYLPPEGPSKNYDLSLDVYMFGVIMVQIIHAVPDIRSPEERYRLIDGVPKDHPMKQVVNSCVMREKDDRPKAEKVSSDLQKVLQNM